MTNKGPQAELISYNLNGMEICASAARISTTKGDAVEIFEKAKEHPKNQELIQKVFASGHKSVIEHAVFTIALKDVSAFTEQFFIECRLASFTVKSRRYVDFGSLGYHIPGELEGENLTWYCQYMDGLFSAYQALLEGGVPKEDARFLLPYSFHSNFYCTLNARELFQILSAIRHGRGQGIPELQDLADQIIRQAETILPGIFSSLEESCFDSENPKPHGDDRELQADNGLYANNEFRADNGWHADNEFRTDNGWHADNEFRTDNGWHAAIDFAGSKSAGAVSDLSYVTPQKAGSIRLLNAPSNPLDILTTAYSMSHPDSDSVPDPGSLFKSQRPRELEQLTYTFLISDVTLSGITHIVRHRMQSIIVPSIRTINHSRCILPDTIRRDAGMLKIYECALKQANIMAKHMYQNPVLQKYNYYYALSGNVMDIMTTINGRELNHFIQLRTCSRAQWEIQKIAVEILRCLRTSCPKLFDSFGPGCYANGFCPEGKMTCGNKKKVVEKFRTLKFSDV